MKFSEIQEACWTGYRQAGMKKKGDRMVPNCVPVSEVKTGPEMTLNDLLYTAAAKAIHQAGLEGVPMDYEEAIKKAAKIYRIPYTPSELPRLLAQRAEIDRKLAMLKQGKQVAKQRRQAKLAPTPAGAEEYWKTHALPTDRIKPPAKTLESQQQQYILYLNGRAVAKFQDENEAEYQGRMIAKRVPETRIEVKKETCTLTPVQLEENLKQWFKEKWVRFGPDGKIRGSCARGSSKEGKPKCLPQAKAHALGKKGRASAAAKKRREDPNPERRGPAKNVATKVKEGFEYGNQVQHPKYGAGQVIKVYSNGIITVNFPNYPDPIDKKLGVQSNFAPGDSGYQSLKSIAKEQYNNDDDWYDDADEFGMPGSEFFPDDDRLRDGDYVRDRQDGEYGEIFRMSGDPTERRVRILDRDGKGWYISPERLVAVDRTDPDIMKYFGKRRHRDMDEASVAKKPQPYNDPKWIDKLTPAERSRLAGPNYKKINKEKQKEKVDEKQDACYRKVKSRYKVWPSAYASGALVQCRKKGAANWGNKKK